MVTATEDKTKCSVANEILQLFARDTSIEQRKGGVYVTWSQSWKPTTVTKRWQCRGQDFYPTWHHKWGRGGTSSTALSQLVRWVQGKPVLPLSTWQYWVGETVQLGRDKGPLIVDLLTEGGYPQSVDCVLCHQPISGGLDWWSLNGVTGPCCSWRSGCEQKPENRRERN